MKKLFKKLSWKLRKVNVGFTLLNFSYNSGFTLNILTISKNYYDYSLFYISFRLPNGADIKYFVIDRMDIFFLHNYLHKMYEDLSERGMWSERGLGGYENFKFNILKRLLR